MLPKGGIFLISLLLTTTTTARTLLAAEENAAIPQQQQQPEIVLPLLPIPPVLTVNAVAANGPIVTTTSTTPATLSAITTEIPDYTKNCFYADAELCQVGGGAPNNQTNNGSSGNTSRYHHHHRDISSNCQCRPHPTIPNSWYCCNITHMSMISTCSRISNWANLHIRNLTIADLDLSLSIYQKLHSLAITDGNITRLVRAFSRFSSIKCLNISNNNLSDISMRSVAQVPSLKILDVSKNNLTSIPNFNQNQNITVDVSDNNNLRCESVYEAISRYSLKFLKPETSFCLMNHTYRWFKSTDYISIKEITKSRPLKDECPVIPEFGNCTCQNQHMLITGDLAEPTTKIICHVDCSNLGLLELPPKLPDNTFYLNVSNNRITSLGKHFHNNPTYKSLVYLVADNNQISSMHDLEGTLFMDHFQLLDLRNNALSSIPEYLLNNVLDNHSVGRNIRLGGNKLQCDCNSAKVLKYWLLERMRDIPDYNEILCRNMPQRVMELREMKLCQSPHDWTDYIYYLIAAEVMLLLALITKVSYDYWVFKTAGYLPWPANKMPKLPCDWLCES